MKPLGVGRRVLPRAAFLRALEDDHPGWRGRGVWRVLSRFGVVPRAYLSKGVITYRQGHEGNLRLTAHELGHATVPAYMDGSHPSMLSLDYWLDVTGYGLRVRDRHALLPLAKAWQRRIRGD